MIPYTPRATPPAAMGLSPVPPIRSSPTSASVRVAGPAWQQARKAGAVPLLVPQLPVLRGTQEDSEGKPSQQRPTLGDTKGLTGTRKESREQVDFGSPDSHVCCTTDADLRGHR
jgi:hypothetical protein